ncbi:hypothetical protein [Catenuloplanes japonicus]|uniref:hypothetical protein n=1 Tax=Catenuloplanes japonicus TaxID=33876 RepID=UPI0005278EB7|nr:hypothetical protein [Catenuloplanes japonicus]
MGAPPNAGLIISRTLALTPLLDRPAGRSRLPPHFFAAAGVCLLAVTLPMGTASVWAVAAGVSLGGERLTVLAALGATP